MYFFASDYDGTLYQDNIVTSKDRKIIQDFRSLGHQFGIATGRHLHSILTEIDKYEIEIDFVIGNNGAAILDASRKELYLAQIDKMIVNQVFDYVVNNLSTEFYFFAVNNGYHYGQKSFVEIGAFDSGDRITLDQAFNSEIICAMFGQLLPDRNGVEIANHLNTVFKGLVQAVPNGEFIDVVLPNDNKAMAISRVLDSLDKKVNRVFTIGDSFNDIEMIKQYDGFVIESGEPHLLALSNRVVKSVGDALEMLISKKM